MQRKSFADMQCPIARALEHTGDGWSMLILRCAFLGVRRFQDFEARLAIAPNTLKRRLDTLIHAGLLARKQYNERPPREAYELTDKGLDFLPVLLSLASWGNRWLAPEGVSIECADPNTGRALDPVLVDRASGCVLEAGRVALQAGPAAQHALRSSLEPRRVLGAGGAA
jgi:DNA-binding HxlR family transcriptional regulator